MKINRIVLVSILLFVLLVPFNAFAADETAAPTEPETTQEPIDQESPAPSQKINDTPLIIDNANIYEGMNNSYGAGYYPTVQNGVASLVLPLVSTETILNNQIRVTYNLGDTASSPFQFQNYDKTVVFAGYPVNSGSGNAECFLVTANIPLIGNRIMGRYPVIITASGQLQDGTPFSQQFTLFVTINDGIDPNAPPETTPTPEPAPVEEPVPQAKIMLESFSVNPSPVVAGEEFNISASFKNTNENQAIRNVKIKVACDTSDIVPIENDTGSFYFKKIAKNEIVTLNMKMKASQSAKAEPHKITFSIAYEGNKATAYTEEESAVFDVMQPIRLEYDEPNIPKELNAGDTIPITVNIMNLGLSTVHNVRMSIDAPGLISENTAFLGNIDSGTSKKGEMYVFIGTLDMTEEQGFSGGNEKYGKTDGKVVLTYEDGYGQEFSDEFKFSSAINPPVITAPEEPKEEEPKKQTQWWVSVVILAVIITVIIIIRVYVKKRQERILGKESSDSDNSYKY